jgi:putative hydrolase of the HAD superfamily
MKIKAILFDVNGTLMDINTNEGNEEIYRAIAHYLTYQGVDVRRWQVRDEYYRIMDIQRKGGGEAHPEFDVTGIFDEMLSVWLPPGLASKAKRKAMPLFLAEMYRGISRNRLTLYPGVRETLDDLKARYPLAVVSDGQSAWAVPEMRAVGIDGYFDPIVVSGDHGFRKPDERLFRLALARLKARPEECLYVGNDMHRDVYGAGRLGMKTVFFRSNQGQQQMNGVEPDYIVYNFWEVLNAVRFFEER